MLAKVERPTLSMVSRSHELGFWVEKEENVRREPACVSLCFLTCDQQPPASTMVDCTLQL